MEIKQAFPVKAPRAKVWAGLMDPNILRQAIPGCQSVQTEQDDTFDVVLVLRIAGQRVRFTGAVELDEVVPEKSFAADGSVRIAGFGFSAAHAQVALKDAPAGTTLVDATVTLNISGKIAFIGERMITRHALRLATEFFRRFGQLVKA